MQHKYCLYSPTVCTDREGLPCGSGGPCPRIRGATVPQSCGGRVVTRGSAATYGGGHLPEHDYAESVRTPGWDWEEALQTHEKERNKLQRAQGAAREN